MRIPGQVAGINAQVVFGKHQRPDINAQVVFGKHQRPDAACGSDGPDHKPNEQTVGSTRLFNYHANHSPSNHRHGKRNP